ncbi:putative reverse transcriptase domain-containing protein [Tanacetum coccineum]
MRLEDVAVFGEFHEVFPEDLPGIPPTRQVEFRIDLVPGAAPVARIDLEVGVYPLRVEKERHPKDCILGLGYGHYEFKSALGKRFIEGFSKIAKTMTKLTQKGVKFDWGDKQETAFQLLKQKLCSAPILALPEGSEDFIAYCDASKKGLLALCLMQRGKRKERRTTKGSGLVMDYWLDLPKQIRKARRMQEKLENIKKEDVGGMLVRIQKIGEIQNRKLEPLYGWNSMLNGRSKTSPPDVGKCLTCASRVKAEKLRDHQAAPFEALYGRKCRSPVCWAEVGQVQLTGPELVQETTERIIQVKQRDARRSDRTKALCPTLKRSQWSFIVGDKSYALRSRLKIHGYVNEVKPIEDEAVVQLSRFDGTLGGGPAFYMEREVQFFFQEEYPPTFSQDRTTTIVAMS